MCLFVRGDFSKFRSRLVFPRPRCMKIVAVVEIRADTEAETCALAPLALWPFRDTRVVWDALKRKR